MGSLFAARFEETGASRSELLLVSNKWISFTLLLPLIDFDVKGILPWAGKIFSPWSYTRPAIWSDLATVLMPAKLENGRKSE